MRPPVAPRQTLRGQPLAAKSMEQEREPAQGRMKSRLWVVAGLGVGVGVGQAEPDPANRPALAPHSVAGSVVGDRLALDQSAAPGFGPEAEAEAGAGAGAVDQPVLAPPLMLAFGTLVGGQLAPVQTAAEAGAVAGSATEFG